jgi:NAD(P)H dehydrogenase (quinone)
MSVAVIGGTGTIGPHIVRSLQARGSAVKVITRDAERAGALLPHPVEICQADITDHDSIIEAVAGASAVLLLTSHAHDMTDVQLRIIRALRRSGVRIVKISGTSSAINPDGPYTCRQHWEVEKILGSSGQPFVVLRPNAFMQTLIGQILIPGVRATGAVANALGTSGISFIDARDVGECAAVALLSDEWDGQTLVLTGPRSVTYQEIADALGDAAGVRVPCNDITPADIGVMMKARGLPEWEAEHFEEMYEMFRRGESEFVSGDVRRLSGREPRSVEAYIAEQASDLPLAQIGQRGAGGRT